MSFRGIKYIQKKKSFFIFNVHSHMNFQGDFHDKKFNKIIEHIFLEMGKSLLCKNNMKI